MGRGERERVRERERDSRAKVSTEPNHQLAGGRVSGAS